MGSDLDQLYFDRVHPIAPIIQRSRYFSWTMLPLKRTCLQQAMRASASAASAHFRELGATLYESARQTLETMSDDDPDVEQIQAWLLLANYEIIRMPHQQATMTINRALKMLQVAHVDDIGTRRSNPAYLSGQYNNEWSHLEEPRRTFWFAYCLDRLANLHTKRQPILHEEVVDINIIFFF